jgi:transposase InsO family protein
MVMPNMLAMPVAENFMDGVVTRHGCPERIISDRGSQFTGKMFGKLNELLRIKQLFTTSHHPNMNGKVERVHRSLKGTLAIVVKQEGVEWDWFLQICAFVIRTRFMQALGCSFCDDSRKRTYATVRCVAWNHFARSGFE